MISKEKRASIYHAVLVETHKSYDQIAQEHGVSKTLVLGIVRRAGVRRKRGGAAGAYRKTQRPGCAGPLETIRPERSAAERSKQSWGEDGTR